MVKKIAAICLILAVVAGAAKPGYCYGPFRKLCRGVCNMIFSPCEIVNRINEVSRDAGGVEGVTTGLFKGATMMVYRAGIGFFEVLLFPIPIPDRYEPALKDPEFFFFQWPSDNKTEGTQISIRRDKNA